MSDSDKRPSSGREDSGEKEAREQIEKASRDPDSVRGSGAPATGNPGVGTETGKYED